MPRPDASTAFISAVQSQYVKPAFLVDITFTNETVHVWSGVGTITYNGNTYLGVGSLGTISSIEEGSDVYARGIVLSLSGIDPTLIPEIIANYNQGLPALVHLAMLEANGTVLGAITSFSGLTDQPTLSVSGETATLSIACENRLVEMNTTSSFRRYTNEDQQIDYEGDTAFLQVCKIYAETLYWGRVPGDKNLGISS